MKKDLDFVISRNKLEIVGLTDDGKAWVETLKLSSRRVKPSSKRYVINAFRKWQRLRKTSDASPEMSIDGSNDINVAISTNAVNARQQQVPNVSSSKKFAISALFLGVQNILTYMYRIFFRR